MDLPRFTRRPSVFPSTISPVSRSPVLASGSVHQYSDGFETMVKAKIDPECKMCKISTHDFELMSNKDAGSQKHTVVQFMTSKLGIFSPNTICFRDL